MASVEAPTISKFAKAAHIGMRSSNIVNNIAYYRCQSLLMLIGTIQYHWVSGFDLSNGRNNYASHWKRYRNYYYWKMVRIEPRFAVSPRTD